MTDRLPYPPGMTEEEMRSIVSAESEDEAFRRLVPIVERLRGMAFSGQELWNLREGLRQSVRRTAARRQRS